MSVPCTSMSPDTIMILPCSGASNVGQLSHQAAVELSEAGFGRMFSLAGIAAGLEPFVAEVRKVRMIVAVDGCETACSRRILENSGMDCTNHLIVTSLGIARDAGLQINGDDLQLVKDAVQACCAEAKPIVRLGGCMCGI